MSLQESLIDKSKDVSTEERIKPGDWRDECGDIQEEPWARLVFRGQKDEAYRQERLKVSAQLGGREPEQGCFQSLV